MFKFRLEWIIIVLVFLACMLVFSGFESRDTPDYSIQQAQAYMQLDNWDSAKIHAVHVLADISDEQEISLARTIISLANENIENERELKAEAKRMAYQSLARRYDKEGKVLWYKDNSSPDYESANAFYLYMGSRGEEVWMRLRIQYSAYDYLFINQVLIDTDSAGYAFTPKEKVRRNHGEKMVWEWLDESFTPDMHEMFYDIAYSKKVNIRFIGTASFDERELSQEEKKGIGRVLKAYELSLE
ncbi:MAG: hypothetical protein AAF696_02985 [Bacteroidota bacterium]